MSDAIGAQKGKTPPWLITVATRAGSGPSASGWIWGARLEGEAKKALAQFLLQTQRAEQEKWKGSWSADSDAGLSERAERALRETSFEPALGWARSAIWALGHQMRPSSGRYPLSFADPSAIPLGGSSHGPVPAPAAPECVEIGFFTILGGAQNDAAARQFMQQVFRPVAQILRSAGPAAMKNTFWMSRLLPIDAPVSAVLIASMVEREEILGEIQKARSASNAQPSGGEDPGEDPAVSADALPKKAPARRL